MATPVSSLHRSQFPKGFTFGSSSAAFQIEGASFEGGRGPSIWDTFALKNGLISDPCIGNVAIDHYHRYKEDVKIMKQIGLDAYRFSFSWSRILPKGSIKGGVNKEGIAFYNNLINELLANGIEPFATLFHWDLPQALEDEYGGFLGPQIIDDFRDYAELCFNEFGDRVKYWTTHNEPWFYSYGGYAVGTFAPGRGYRPKEQETSKVDLLPPSESSYSPYLKSQGPSSVGDPGTEPYLVAHHLLLSHAAASKLYKEKYKKSQKGVIGIALCSQWSIPYSESKEDEAAVERSHDYRIGWFMDPLTTGDYPASMRARAGARLPKFTKEESEMVKGSIDFLGLNYYTSYYIAEAPDNSSINGGHHFVIDPLLSYSGEKDGIPLGEQGGSPWLYVYPEGLKKLLLRLKTKYNNPLIYITENGIDEERDDTLSLWDSLYDQHRISYHRDHLLNLKDAMEEGSNVKGYFAWSIFDNFQWGSGFDMRFGINFIDYNNDLTRYPKLSAGWFRQFLEKEDDN